MVWTSNVSSRLSKEQQLILWCRGRVQGGEGPSTQILPSPASLYSAKFLSITLKAFTSFKLVQGRLEGEIYFLYFKRTEERTVFYFSFFSPLFPVSSRGHKDVAFSRWIRADIKTYQKVSIFLVLIPFFPLYTKLTKRASVVVLQENIIITTHSEVLCFITGTGLRLTLLACREVLGWPHYVDHSGLQGTAHHNRDTDYRRGP